MCDPEERRIACTRSTRSSGDRGRRQDLPARWGEEQARRQSRDVDRSRRHRPPDRRLRWRALRDPTTARRTGATCRTCRSPSSTRWRSTRRRPFYNVYGGTQDNHTMGGPSRTQFAHGAANSDWTIVRTGDGFQPVVDPTNPDIVYAEVAARRTGALDRKTGERVDIQPKEEPGEPGLRWNWDSPLIISPHSPTRLYFAANRLYRSDDRGDTWTPGERRPHAEARPQPARGDGPGVGASMPWPRTPRPRSTGTSCRSPNRRGRKGCSTSAPTTGSCR